MLFQDNITDDELARRVASGYCVKATKLSEEFDFTSLSEQYAGELIPLMAITEKNQLRFVSPEDDFNPRPGETVISLVQDER